MILVDTSAWVEFLRGTDSVVCNAVDALLDDEFAICHAILMEVLAGARDERHLEALRGLLARAVVFDTTPADYDHAASLYRHCRRQGATVRKLIDCLIGAISIREGVQLLHRDADFDVLEKHTPLRCYSL